MVKVSEHVAKIADKYISRDGGPPRPHYCQWAGIDPGGMYDTFAAAFGGTGLTATKIEKTMERLRGQTRASFVFLDEIGAHKVDALAYMYKAKQLQSFFPIKKPVEPAERKPRAPRIALDMNRQPRSPRASRTPYLAKQRAGKHKV